MEQIKEINLKSACELFSKQPSSFKVSSNCMWPFIKKGDAVLVKNCKPQELKEGEIIVYRNGDNLFAHRIIEIRENNFITKADMNFKKDRPISGEQIIGRVGLVKKGLFKLNLEKRFFKTINYLLFLLGKLQVKFYSAFKKLSKSH